MVQHSEQYLFVLRRSRVDCYGQAINRALGPDELGPRLELQTTWPSVGRFQCSPCCRQETGGRQIATHQHKLAVGPGTGELEEALLREGPGQDNPADLFTKGVGREKFSNLLGLQVRFS